MAYREQWGRDVVIDLIGYRRYGHNETDEPAYTQPKMAAQIKEHPPVSEIYAEQLIAEGVVDADEVAEDADERPRAAAGERSRTCARRWRRATTRTRARPRSAPASSTAPRAPRSRPRSPRSACASLNEELLRVPDSFTIHRKLRKPLLGRIEKLDSGEIEFGHAEALAFASLLTEGTHIRLTGQDTERGTFSHRHLALHDENTGLRYVPIQNLSGALAPFELHNSPLSEAACLGFEYGYSAASPESLILWEAQFGDFANSAQVIIDSFIVAGESKWGQTTRLTLLLPHGYEGAGPEHSSARIERFIQLGSEGNIRLANPTTAAQYFHLLRRQARIAKPRPLVVFTPKGLLRLRDAASSLDGADRRARSSSSSTTRARSSDRGAGRAARPLQRQGLLRHRPARPPRGGRQGRGRAGSSCSTRSRATSSRSLIASYPNLKKVVWAQEEPKNMGAWSVMARRLPELLPDGVEHQYVGRPQRSSPERGLPGRPPPRAGAHRPHRPRGLSRTLRRSTVAARPDDADRERPRRSRADARSWSRSGARGRSSRSGSGARGRRSGAPRGPRRRGLGRLVRLGCRLSGSSEHLRLRAASFPLDPRSKSCIRRACTLGR